MKSIIIKSAVGLFVVLSVSSAMAQPPTRLSDCDRPTPPELADSISDSFESMSEAQGDVQEFVQASNEYAACMDEAIEELRDDVDQERLEELVAERNATIDDQETVAAAFNREVQEFQADGS